MKKRKLFNHLMYMLIAILLISGFSLSAPASMAAYAQENAANSYVVREGDCLYGIAADILGSGERWKEIQELTSYSLIQTSRRSQKRRL